LWVKLCGSVVKDATHSVRIAGSKPPKDSSCSQLLIDVGVGGSASTWS